MDCAVHPRDEEKIVRIQGDITILNEVELTRAWPRNRRNEGTGLRFDAPATLTGFVGFHCCDEVR